MQGSSEEREARKNMQRQLSDERRVRFQFGEKINVKCFGFGGPDVNVKCQAKEDEIKMSDTFLQRQVGRAHVNFLIGIFFCLIH